MADGLNDGDEVSKHKTDPLKADTDLDGLKDNDEVSKHRTDPLKADTDGGTVNDAQEVAKNMNPLDPTDDVPKPAIQRIEVGKAIVLEGITFKTGKSTIEPTVRDELDGSLRRPEGQIRISWLRFAATPITSASWPPTRSSRCGVQKPSVHGSS